MNVVLRTAPEVTRLHGCVRQKNVRQVSLPPERPSRVQPNWIKGNIVGPTGRLRLTNPRAPDVRPEANQSGTTIFPTIRGGRKKEGEVNV